MGLFGKSKEDKGQDAQIKELQKDIGNCWAWIQEHQKNMIILVKNNNAFIEKNKKQAELNRQVTASVNALIEKDKQHDQKDAEHDALFKGFKKLGQDLDAVKPES